jgi:hypothetical protein
MCVKTGLEYTARLSGSCLRGMRHVRTECRSLGSTSFPHLPLRRLPLTYCCDGRQLLLLDLLDAHVKFRLLAGVEALDEAVLQHEARETKETHRHERHCASPR